MSIVGVEKKRIISSCVGEKSPAQLLWIAKEDPVFKIEKTSHPQKDPFQDFGVVFAAFRETV